VFKAEKHNLIAMLVVFDATFLLRVVLELTVYKDTLSGEWPQFKSIMINFTFETIEDLIHYLNFSPQQRENSSTLVSSLASANDRVTSSLGS
jgi:hypothetical protein